jgi:polar amino acid transport system substrate-binding protein
MPRSLGLYCFISSLALTISLPIAAETISIRADPWLPYSGLGSKAPSGYMVDLARKIAAANGDTIDYANMPWADAKSAVRKGESDCVVGAARGDARDFVFSDAVWGRSQNAFFGLAESHWRFDGMQSLESIKLAVIEGYAYTDELDAYIEAHRNDGKVVVVGGIRRVAMNAVSQLVKKQADVFVEDVNVMQQTLSDLQMTDRVVNLGTLGKLSDIYIACTPAKPRGKVLAKMFSDGLLKLRASGELQKILDGYGLRDWEK